MRLDIRRKKAKFIGKVHSLMQELHFAAPEVLLTIIVYHACSFFGSVLWDMEGPECIRLYKSWNVMTRMVFNINRRTHRYLIESLSNQTHLRTMLFSRLNSFHRSLTDSPKFVVRFLAKIFEDDLRTRFGRNINTIKSETNSNPTKSSIRERMIYSHIPEEEEWRIGMGQETLKVRHGDHVVEG